MPKQSVDLMLRYYELEPFGDDWRQTAEIQSSVINAAGWRTKEGEPVTVDAEDLVPIHPPGWKPKRPVKRELSAEDTQARDRRLAGF